MLCTAESLSIQYIFPLDPDSPDRGKQKVISSHGLGHICPLYISKEIATIEVVTGKSDWCYNAHAGAGKIYPSTRIRRTRSMETMDMTSRAMPRYRTGRLLLLQGAKRLWISR